MNYSFEGALKARQIARILCDATTQVLWRAWKERLQAVRPDVSMTARVGAGQATNHRMDRRNGRSVLTFGRLMVASKFDPAKRARWRTCKEVTHRGYFDRSTNFLSVMSHTAIHEFAHLFQVANNDRLPGSVHNPAFYSVLDELHRNGDAERVKAFLAQAMAKTSIELSSIETLA